MNNDKELELLSLMKSSLAIASNDQDDMLLFLIKSAASIIQAKVGDDQGFYVDNEIYDLAVLQQAINNYLQRSSTTDVNLFDTSFGYMENIIALKAEYQRYVRYGKKELGNG